MVSSSQISYQGLWWYVIWGKADVNVVGFFFSDLISRSFMISHLKLKADLCWWFFLLRSHIKVFDDKSSETNNADLCWCLNSSCQISDHRFLMICHLKLREKKSCHEKKNNNNNGTTGLVIYYDHSPCEMTLRIPRNS